MPFVTCSKFNQSQATQDQAIVAKEAAELARDQAVAAKDALFNDLPSDLNGKGDALIAVKQPYEGAALRRQHDKNTESISIFDAGGKTDTVTGIAAAIRRAKGWGVGKLLFPRGLYFLDELVELDGLGFHLDFDKDAILKRSFNGGAMFLLSGYEYIITGAKLLGNKNEYSNSANAGIFVTGINNHIEKCSIFNMKSHALSTDGALGDGHGEGNVFAYNLIDWCDGVGISQYKSKGCHVLFNKIYNAGAEGITVDVYTSDSVVSSNRIVSAGRIAAVGGIGVDLSYHNMISNNLIKDTKNGLPGICLESQAGNTHHNVITGNSLVANSGHGICIRRRQIIFDAETNEYVPEQGLWGKGDWNILSSNIFRENALGPVRIDDGCIGTVLSGNNYDGKYPSISSNSVATQAESGLVNFRANNTIQRANVTGDGSVYTVPFDNVVYTKDTYIYDTDIGELTVPVSGTYRLTFCCRTTGGNVHDWMVVSIEATGATTDSIRNGTEYVDKGIQMCMVTGEVYLSEGAKVKCTVRIGGGGKVCGVSSDQTHTYFNAYFLG